MTLTLYPAWRQAVENIADAGLAPGRILTREELMRELRIDAPTTIDQYRKAQLAFVEGFLRIKETLLEEHFVDLETVPGMGYRIIEPGKQTNVAIKDGAKAIAKAIRNTGRRLTFIDRSALTSDERRENDDAVAKLSRLQSMIGRPSRFLTLTGK